MTTGAVVSVGGVPGMFTTTLTEGCAHGEITGFVIGFGNVIVRAIVGLGKGNIKRIRRGAGTAEHGCTLEKFDFGKTRPTRFIGCAGS